MELQEARNHIIKQVMRDPHIYRELINTAVNDYLKWWDTVEELEDQTGVKLS